MLRVPPLIDAMPYVRDDPDTRAAEERAKATFRQCVGKVYRVRGIGTNAEDEDSDDLELWLRGSEDCDDAEEKDGSIWIEQTCVEIVA